MEQEIWKEKHYSFFKNSLCEYFPCHPTDDPENFNCLFCYCPLYLLGERCGGNFEYTENGIKSCGKCTFPHRRENYGAMMERYRDILDMLKEQRTRV
ncbi:MAG: cysteine-rich small domain-containing protein [Lachnospiraceae bacterium]|nr:cysteine-rich small domain-containing protein [Lachnospiraceae bacterium]